MKREPIPASHWWQAAANVFEKVLREYLRRAQAAEAVQQGHDCGHQFEITVRSKMHVSGPGEHTDAGWWGDDSTPVVIRAHNLRDALLIAAALPLSEWFADTDDSYE